MAKASGTINLNSFKQTHDDAEKVATNYLSADSTGIMVADMRNGEKSPSDSTLTGRNVLITNTDVNIRDGVMSLAQFGDNVRLGKQNTGRLVITDSNVNVYGKNGEQAVSFGSINNATTGYATVTEYLKVLDLGIDDDTYNGVYLTFQAQEIISCYKKNEDTEVPVNMAMLDDGFVAYNNSDLISGDRVVISYKTNSQISYLNIGDTNTTEANSITAGSYNSMHGANSLISGYSNIGAGKNTIVGGENNESYGDSNACFGGNNTVNGDGCSVSGWNNNVVGDSVVCSGLYNTVKSDYSGVIGNSNRVTGDNSLVVGEENIVNASNAFVCGSYNVQSNNDLLCVGNGVADTRADAFCITGNNNAIFAGALYSGNRDGETTTRKMFLVSSSTLDNQTINQSSTTSFNFSIAKTGYVPIAIRAIRINNATTGGEASSFCFAYSWYIDNDQFYIGIRNTATGTTAKIKIVVDIFYIADTAM